MPEGDVFAALANPTRRELLRLLRERGEQPVQRLADHFDMRRPSLSEHLRVLKDAGLVVDRADGTRRLYQLNPTGIEAMRAYFDTFWNHALAAFKDAVEKEDS